MPAKIDRQGIHPLPAKPLPPVLLRAPGSSEGVRAAYCRSCVHGDRDAAYQALITNSKSVQNPIKPSSVRRFAGNESSSPTQFLEGINMASYFIGGDIGATHTRILVSDGW